MATSYRHQYPGQHTAAVVPSDAGDPGEAMGALGLTYSEDTIQAFDHLFVGVAGDVTIRTIDLTTVLFKACAIGIHNIVGRRVMATGTAATNMVQITDGNKFR